MRRLFGKGGKSATAESSENISASEENPKVELAKHKKKVREANEDSDKETSIRKAADTNVGGGGDAGRRRRRRRTGEDTNDEVLRASKRREENANSDDEERENRDINLKRHGKQKLKSRKSLDDSGKDEEDKLLKLKQKPHQLRTKEASQDYTDIGSESEDDKEKEAKPLERKKGKKKLEKGELSKRQSSTSIVNDSKDEFSQFLNKSEIEHLPKIESGKGGQFLSSMYKYKRPISSFKIRARLLKYPTFSDQDTWPGDFGVVDDRVFGWQEKVFGRAEAKRYKKFENCRTELEKMYHAKITDNPDSVGKFLYSYVEDDPYVLKKKTRNLLVRRCPVPHIRIARDGSRFSSDGKLLYPDGDGASLNEEMLGGEISGSDSIDFDEPVSSSTPKTKRKRDVRREAQEKAKNEKRELEKQEREQKELEKKNKKLEEAKQRREKAEEKKRTQEAKKIEESKRTKLLEDKERKEEYMKKYKYSKRPSLPLGARLRSVQLTPSPRKLSKKHKSRATTRSSEFSTDYPDDDKDSDGSLGKQKRKKDVSESDSLKMPQQSSSADERTRASRRVGHELSERPIMGTGIRTSKRNTSRKFQDRYSYKNSQVMYIMASVPYLLGRFLEVVVCVIRNLPQQGILVFKPAFGYRNIEAKRNHVYRITCEPHLPASPSHSTKKKTDAKDRHLKRKPQALDDFIGFFELVPKNELRLTVMGEITSVEGFDSSPLCVYYIVDIPKGWRNDSVLSNTEGITHTCYTNHNSVAHFSHEFSFHLAFSMDSVQEANSYPTPVIAFMVVSMTHPLPRIIYEGYGYVCIPMTPGSHYINVKTWKPRPKTTMEKMRATFLNITPSLQDMKFAHIPRSEYEDLHKANLIGLKTDPSGLVKFRLHVIHQTPMLYKEDERKLDLLEKMSSATILKSVQAVIEAFQRAREKAASLKTQYN